MLSALHKDTTVAAGIRTHDFQATSMPAAPTTPYLDLHQYSSTTALSADIGLSTNTQNSSASTIRTECLLGGQTDNNTSNIELIDLITV